MPHVAYVNGHYVTFTHATVHIEDRGCQFADGVYEVVAIWNGLPIDLILHLDRLNYSLNLLDIRSPLSRSVLKIVLQAVASRNRLHEGILYIQVSRGVSRREHYFPPQAVRSTLIVTARTCLLATDTLFENGVKVVTTNDLRWKHCNIKSIALLPNVLAKQMARTQNASEAWLLANDLTITEGTSSNAWIVTDQGLVITRPLSDSILNGVTRTRVLSLVTQLGLKVAEEPFTLEEAQRAREAFLTSSTSFVLPVVSIDGKTISDGKPGKITRRLRTAYLSWISNKVNTGW